MDMGSEDGVGAVLWMDGMDVETAEVGDVVYWGPRGDEARPGDPTMTPPGVTSVTGDAGVRDDPLVAPSVMTEGIPNVTLGGRVEAVRAECRVLTPFGDGNVTTAEPWRESE